MMKLRAVTEYVAETPQPRTWHQPKGDEVQLLTVVEYGKHKGVSERTDSRPTGTSTLCNFQLQLS